MRLTPAQVGMSLLLGRFVSRASTRDLKTTILRGRELLKRIARGHDFGFDAMKWHDYLWATDAGGYKWCRRSEEKWAKDVRHGIARPEWIGAVKELEAANLAPGGGIVPVPGSNDNAVFRKKIETD